MIISLASLLYCISSFSSQVALAQLSYLKFWFGFDCLNISHVSIGCTTYFYVTNLFYLFHFIQQCVLSRCLFLSILPNEEGRVVCWFIKKFSNVIFSLELGGANFWERCRSTVYGWSTSSVGLSNDLCCIIHLVVLLDYIIL